VCRAVITASHQYLQISLTACKLLRIPPYVRIDYQPDYFFQLLLRHLSPSLRVLEIGAGSGQGHQNRFAIRDRVKDYVGIDPDSAVLFNPYLGEGYQGSADSLPFADQSFDLVFHNYVAEHFPTHWRVTGKSPAC